MNFLAKLFAFLPSAIIPIEEIYAFSNSEKIHLLCKKINECISEVNTFDELFEEVKNYLTDLDENIQQIVKDNLEKMYEDGTLKEMLEEISKDFFAEIEKQIAELKIYIDSKINDIKFVPYLSPQRTMRHLYVTGYNDFRYDSNTFQGYAFPQGYVTFVKNNIRYHISANPGDHKTNHGMLRVYKDGENDMCASVIIPMGHGNGMCYDSYEDYIYIAWCNEYDLATGTKGLSNKITRIKFADLLNSNNTFETKEFPHSFASISTDKNEDGTCQLYGLQHDEFRMYKLYWEDAEEDSSIFLEKNNTYNPIGTRLQGHTTDEKYIYVLDSFPSTLCVYDKKDGHFIWKYDFPYTINNRWELGECEDLTVEDGILYLQTTDHVSPNEYNCFDYQQLFICNLIKNDTFESDMLDFKSGNVFLIQVDSSNKNANPQGTADKPFNILQEAINFANICPAKRIQIKIVNQCDGGFNVIATDKTLYIYGAITDNYINSGGFLILGGQVTIKKLDIFNNATKESCKVAGIYCENCNCWVDGVNIIPYSSTFRSASDTISTGFYARCTNGSYWSNTPENEWDTKYPGVTFKNIVTHSCNIVVGSGA